MSSNIPPSGSRHKLLVYFLAVVLFLATSMLWACMLGPVEIGITEVLKVFLKRFSLASIDEGVNETVAAIVWDIRFSRVLLAVLVGWALAVSGAAFQGVLINPLADPFTIGVASGAAFGATIVIFMGGAVDTIPVWLKGLGVVPLFSFLGAMIALFFVVTFSRLAGGLRRETMILSGIVVATFLSALIALLKALDEESVQAIVFWIMGSLQGRSWAHVGFSAPYIFLGTLLLFKKSTELDILTLGDEQAKHLGVEVERVRFKVLVGASILTAACVSVSGIIGFVGLVTPHLARLIVGARHRELFLASGFLGAIIMVWSDAISRVLLPGGEEVPVGVITALLGGPFFFFVLLKSRRGEAGDV